MKLLTALFPSLLWATTTLPSTVIADYNSVEVQDCSAVGVSDGTTCDDWCGDAGRNYIATDVTEDTNIVSGFSCSCGGNEDVTPEDVTKRCEVTYDTTVQDCKAEGVSDQDTCENTYCGGNGSGRLTYIRNPDDNSLSSLVCVCLANPNNPNGAFTKKCESTYELVVEDCTAQGVSSEDTCENWCDGIGDDDLYTTQQGSAGTLDGHQCECKEGIVILKKCQSNYVVETCESAGITPVILPPIVKLSVQAVPNTKVLGAAGIPKGPFPVSVEVL